MVMHKAEELIIHTSDSPVGCATMIKGWHTAPKPEGRGWRDIGYNFVITNGYWNYRMYEQGKQWPFADGTIEAGRPFDTDPVMMDDEIGAHCYGWNGKTLGACLIGKNGNYTVHQLLSLRDIIVNYLYPEMGWQSENILGHYELDKKKTCPDMDMELSRAFLGEPELISQLVLDIGKK